MNDIIDTEYNTKHSNNKSKMSKPAANTTTSAVSFFDFMKSRLIKKGEDKVSTNTRIGDPQMNIFGGSYSISDEDYDQFLQLYYDEVFIKKKPEYLTEKQLDADGPILIDIDLRFNLDVAKRAYTDDHIEDILDVYLAKLNSFYEFDDDTRFPVYVFEKANMNRLPEKDMTKDGIHIIIGIKCDHVTQQILRKEMIEEMPQVWSDIPITNSWDDVFDNGISAGHVNWQLYGSRKPHHEPYMLTKVYNVTYNSDNEDLDKNLVHLQRFDLKKNFKKLSARYSEHIEVLFKNSFVTRRQTMIDSGMFDTRKKRVQNAAGGVADAMDNIMGGVGSANSSSGKTIFQVTNREELAEVLREFLDNITRYQMDYELREAHDYTMTLPVTYYGDGSYLKWIRVGWALRNISDKLFVVWVAFSAQSPKFCFSDIHGLYDKWLKFDMNNPNGLTKRSIMHWSKMDAKDKYKMVRENSIEFYIDQTLDEKSSKAKTCGDVDLATVLYHLYKDEYVCISVKANIWYTYKKHRWIENDSGTSLRKAISMEMRDMYRKRASKLMESHTQSNNEQMSEGLKNKFEQIMEICLRLGRTNDKKNIMTEAKELFYDGTFLQKIDTNPYLLCFNNGVIDFKEKVFRRGYPEDYISKTTGIDYRKVNYGGEDATIVAEIQDFMRKLFPVKELHDYMWEHLASTLIGTSSNQTFNMYIGVGSNGKSVLVSLMEYVLGEYKGDVPLSLVTDKRTKIGGLAPEMVALKGVRYAVMQEPSKGDRINEGVMKQITSGIDPIQARAPYMPEAIKFIPQFKLVVCSNEFMEIKSQDHGTWRRIRVVDFMSLFTDNPTYDDPDKPYQYPLDKNIKEKFVSWKEVFAAMLVEKAFATGGIVTDCNIVMKSSNSYRESQDYIAEFIADRILIDPNGHIIKTELKNEFSTWFQGTYGRGEPSQKDVQAYMDKRFGKFDKHKCWKGCRINYENEAGFTGEDEESNESGDHDIADVDVNDL